MKVHSSKGYYALRFVLDSITVLSAWWLTYFIRFVLISNDIFQLRSFLLFSPVILVVFIYFLDLHNLMEKDLIDDFPTEFSSIIKVCSKSFFTMILFFYFVNYSIFSRLSLFVFFFLSILFLTVERIILDDILSWGRKKGKNISNVLLIGNDSKLQKYAEMLQSCPEKGLNPVAWMDSGSCGLKHIKRVDNDINHVIRDMDVKLVIIGYDLLDSEKMNSMLVGCYDLFIPVVVLADLPYTFLNNQVEKEKEFNLFYYNSFTMSFTNRVVKRIIDLIGSIVGLILFSPLFIVFPIIIKTNSKGPAFYGQKRLTIDGKEFTMWKFRSMRTDAEQTSGAVWADKNDDRTTSIGKFMRATSLDEIPQFWNVFTGRMSLVGPRPERPELIENFKKEIPGYMLRHKMKAGITGWAQINGLRGNTSLKKRIEYDLDYINNWSHLMDIKILFLTFLKGFVNENAY